MTSVLPAGTDWHAELQEWLQPFLAAFKRSEQRCWVPLYLQGLLGFGARKSVEPMVDGVRFGMVLADAGYGSSAGFRAGLTQRGLRWAVGAQPTQKVYPANVTLNMPANPPVGRPAK
jgi:hypothetical protein